VIANIAAPADSRLTLAIKALLYSAGLALYLLPLSSGSGLLAAVVAGIAGMSLASLARRRLLRLAPALIASLVGLLCAWALGDFALRASLLPRLLGVRVSFALSEVLAFGLGALALIFALRTLSLARASLSILEVLFVAGAAVAAFADHRNRMLNQPRFFSDWAWALGVDPGTVLVGVGIAATLAAVFLFLRGQPLLKLVTTLLLLLALGVGFFLVSEKRVKTDEPVDSLGLSGKGQGKGKDGKGKGGGAASNNPFKDDYSGSGAPSPVAIAILRDDYEPPGQLMYFRQSTLSLYNGHHLVSGSSEGWDSDVFGEFPRESVLRAPPVQNPAEHLLVPTTMYLLVDHPQPMALSQAVRLAPTTNPNPQQFVAAYDVQSMALSVSPQRLLGRRSIPESWSAAQRAHYLAMPDDPRYQALADIIVRDIDPRFAEDVLARAWAIKRYLEREGFYTMKSTHASSSDPTADFLFGSLRGYCVHFAHAAVYLLRSQGIAARVALGYAVQTATRGGGSAVLIMSDRAHAWPEIFVEGVGWVTFDVHPERTDVAAPPPVDYDLEKLLGELARNDKTAGLTAEGKPLRIPWRAVALGTGALLVLLLGGAYTIKLSRRLAPRVSSPAAYPRLAYRALLDELSDLGLARQPGETRERHAARLAQLSPKLSSLTREHLAAAWGGKPAPGRAEAAAFAELARAVRAELRSSVGWWRRAGGWLNPVGWAKTR
jgi:protein-glutamine gamma-glutamyltransferase